jgi:hypothetical protein
MSYTKREWATGNVVGAVDLNRMEQGIEDSRGILVVNSVYDSENDSDTLDKTWQEIYDAFPFVIVNEASFKSNIIRVGINNGDYIVETGLSFITNSASGYPTSQVAESL